MTDLFPKFWTPAEQDARNALLAAQAKVRSVWAKAVGFEGHKPDAVFVVLSHDNPFRVELDTAIREVQHHTQELARLAAALW